MRSILQNTSAYDLTLRTGARFGTVQQTLAANYAMAGDQPVVLNFDCNGTARTITLPSITNGIPSPGSMDGRMYILENVGTSGTATIVANADDGGATVATLLPGQSTMLVASMAKLAWYAPGVEASGGPGIPSKNVNLNTVGNGAITAAMLQDAIITRGGTQTAPFTDTTANATQIFNQMSPFFAGMSWYVTIVNATAFAETIAGGTNVTMSGQTVIPAGSTAEFLLTVNSSTSVTMQGLFVSQTMNLPTAQSVTNAGAGATTAAAGDLTGAQTCYLTVTAVGAANYTTRTAALMFADTPGAFVGMTWNIWVRNTNAGTTTVVGGTGVTVSGTATVAQNTSRLFEAVFASATTVTLTSFGVTATV